MKQGSQLAGGVDLGDHPSSRGGFGEILPQFTDPAPASQETATFFNFGLGDLRHIHGPGGPLAGGWPGEAAASFEALPGTQGLQALNAALARIDADELGCATRGEDILLCYGACDGLVLSLLAATAPGDGVAFPVPAFPYWWNFSGTGRKAFPLYFEDAEAYRSSFGDRVLRLIEENPSIRAVVLNAPQNPMGVGIEDQQLAVLQGLAEKGVVVIVDDVARSLADPLAGWWRILDPDLVIVVNSFTKRYAAPGLRLGWIRAREQWLLSARDLGANWRVGVANPVANLGLRLVAAMGRGEAVAREVQQRRQALVETVANRGDGFPRIHSRGDGLYALVDCRCGKLESPGPALKAAAEAAGVTLLGSQFLFPPDFQADASHWMLRLSIAGENRIREGLERLYEVGDRFLAGLQ